MGGWKMGAQVVHMYVVHDVIGLPGGGGPSMVRDTTESPRRITRPSVRFTSLSSEMPWP
jgi:hypothetical protein